MKKDISTTYSHTCFKKKKILACNSQPFFFFYYLTVLCNHVRAL